MVLEDAIGIGDLVVFERRGPKKAAIRRLGAGELGSYAGLVFRVEPGDSPESRRFEPLDPNRASPQ